jgi:hypothetical protein
VLHYDYHALLSFFASCRPVCRTSCAFEYRFCASSVSESVRSNLKKVHSKIATFWKNPGEGWVERRGRQPLPRSSFCCASLVSGERAPPSSALASLS